MPDYATMTGLGKPQNHGAALTRIAEALERIADAWDVQTKPLRRLHEVLDRPIAEAGQPLFCDGVLELGEDAAETDDA